MRPLGEALGLSSRARQTCVRDTLAIWEWQMEMADAIMLLKESAQEDVKERKRVPEETAEQSSGWQGEKREPERNPVSK